MLRIGPGQREGIDRRYLDVRVATASGGSESSLWVCFLPRAQLLAALADPATVAAVIAAIDGAVDSLRRHELR